MTAVCFLQRTSSRLLKKSSRLQSAVWDSEVHVVISNDLKADTHKSKFAVSDHSDLFSSLLEQLTKRSGRSGLAGCRNSNLATIFAATSQRKTLEEVSISLLSQQQPRLSPGWLDIALTSVRVTATDDPYLLTTRAAAQNSRLNRTGSAVVKTAGSRSPSNQRST